MISWRAFCLLIAVSAFRISAGHRVPQTQAEGDSYCYATLSNPYLYFASKTSYSAVYSQNDVQTIPDECSARQLWMLIRHGARYPLQKKIQAFHELHKIKEHIIRNHEHRHRGNLCERDLKNLKAWKLDDVPLSESDHLTSQGYDDLFNIGDRTFSKFPHLFEKQYDKEYYKIQYTKHSKTKHSALAFTSGLFRNVVDIPEPNNDDLLTMIYPNCKVTPIPGANDPQGGKMERNLFKDGGLVEEVVQNVSTRLGYSYSHQLKLDDVDNMYDMCRYGKSWKFQDVSPWCAVFSEEELKILEYIGDLSYYYNSGHGYSANLRTGCPLVKDMMDRFRELATNDNNDEPFGVFYFGHSTTMYNLFARLGLGKDTEHIRHDNYYEMENRKWHTSLIAPFSGNFAAVFLTCSTGEPNRVVFFHNEAPFKFTGCRGYVCDWTVLEQMYSNITRPETCNFDFCKQKDSTTKEENETYKAEQDKNRTNKEKHENTVLGHKSKVEVTTNKTHTVTITNQTAEDQVEDGFVISGEEQRPIIKHVHEKEMNTYSPKTIQMDKSVNVMYFFILFAVFMVVFLIYNKVRLRKSTQTKFIKMHMDCLSESVNCRI